MAPTVTRVIAPPLSCSKQAWKVPVEPEPVRGLGAGSTDSFERNAASLAIPRCRNLAHVEPPPNLYVDCLEIGAGSEKTPGD